MADAYGNVLEPPGTGTVAEVKPGDVIAAMGTGILEKGITVLGGQGLIPAGQVMARQTSTKKYVKYDTDGSGGAEVAVGVLREAVETGTGGTSKDKLGNLIMGGVVKLSKLTDLDSGAVADLNGRSDTNRDFFIF